MPPSGSVAYEQAAQSLAGEVNEKNNRSNILTMLENGLQQHHQQKHRIWKQYDADITRRTSTMVTASKCCGEDHSNNKKRDCCCPPQSQDSSSSEDTRNHLSKKLATRRKLLRQSRTEFCITSIRIANIVIWAVMLFVFYRSKISIQQPTSSYDMVSDGQQNHHSIGSVVSRSRLRAVEGVNGGARDGADQTSKTFVDKTKTRRKGIVHIIHTRFMQDQPDLIDLGLARLEMLKSFALASLKQQTSTNFVWIIRTDPSLNNRIREDLVDALESNFGAAHYSDQVRRPYRYLLVASNENPKVQTDTLLKSLTSDSVWGGNFTEVMDYLSPGTIASSKLSSSRSSVSSSSSSVAFDDVGDSNVVVLESRLDSDDSLNKYFVDAVQASAKSSFLLPSSLFSEDEEPTSSEEGGEAESTSSEEEEEEAVGKEESASSSEEENDGDAGGVETEEEETPVSWKVWCASRHVEWQYRTMWEKAETNDSAGGLFMIKDTECISTGLTIGYPAASEQVISRIPVMKHNQLAKRIPSCNDEQTFECRDHVDLGLTGLRARTPTSAGMLNILLKQNKGRNTMKKYTKAGGKKQEALQVPLWRTVEHQFGLTQENARRLHSHIRTNMRAIAADNLKGQCTNGHSCKESSKEILQMIIDHPESV